MSRRRKEGNRGGRNSPPSRAGNHVRAQTGPAPPLFTRWTGIFGGAGLAVALLGFLFLSQGSIVLAPVLLVVAFLVLFPLALVK